MLREGFTVYQTHAKKKNYFRVCLFLGVDCPYDCLFGFSSVHLKSLVLGAERCFNATVFKKTNRTE